jgi:hypothetical protein
VVIAASGCQDSVVIDVSSREAGTRNRKVYGVIQEFVGQTLTLISSEEINVGTGVTAQSKDLIFFGEVLSSVPERGAKWSTNVRVKRRMLIV